MLVCQISDLHLKAPGKLCYGRVDTAAYLRSAVETIGRLAPAPDAVLVTGDLVDGGRPEEYLHLVKLLEPLALPVYVIPGNHDRREALRETLVHAGHTYLANGRARLEYAVEFASFRIVALDSLVEGEDQGALVPESLEWLEQELNASHKPTLLALHHPPVPIGIGHMDRVALAEPERLAAVIARHRHVERVLCGHVHRGAVIPWAGTIVVTCPSTAHQVTPVLSPDAPEDFTLEPPALVLHYRPGAAALVSHVVPIGRFAGPYPFSGS